MSIKRCASGKQVRFMPFEEQPEVHSSNGWEDLAEAIILLAVKDYRTALKGLKKRPDNRELLKMKKDCERFFFSGWFAALTELEPGTVVDGIRREMAV